MGYAVEIRSLHVIQQASRIFPVKRIMVLWMVGSICSLLEGK